MGAMRCCMIVMVLFNNRGGAILPLGGTDLGYKGFALGLFVEALTNALGGHGRADGETRWGASVFLQLINPEQFGGREAFVRETSFFAQVCAETPVPHGNPCSSCLQLFQRGKPCPSSSVPHCAFAST